MNTMLLGISPEYLYFHGSAPQHVSDYHKPYFLAFCPKERDIETVRREVIQKCKESTTETNPLSKIQEIGEIESYRSFWNFNEKRSVFKVYTKKSYFVPEISDELFFHHGLYTAEHDIPYHQRALVDLAAEKTMWLFDTNGVKKTLKTLVYDIETTNYQEGRVDIPIDIIGYAPFDITFESQKNLDEEEFSFDRSPFLIV